MIKVPFEILRQQVDLLYAKKFDENDVDAINRHCEFISDFIEAAGWDTDDYLRHVEPRSNQLSN